MEKIKFIYITTLILFSGVFFPSMYFFRLSFLALSAENTQLKGIIFSLQDELNVLKAAALLVQKRTEYASNAADLTLPLVYLLTAIVVLTLGGVIFLAVYQSNATDLLSTNLRGVQENLELVSKNTERFFEYAASDVSGAKTSVIRSNNALVDEAAKYTEVLQKRTATLTEAINALDDVENGTTALINSTKASIQGLLDLTNRTMASVKQNSELLDNLKGSLESSFFIENSSIIKALEVADKKAFSWFDKVSSDLLDLEVFFATKIDPVTTSAVIDTVTKVSGGEGGSSF